MDCNCLICKRKITKKEKMEENSDLCLECEEQNMVENEMSDHGTTPERLFRWYQCQKAVKAKGGKPNRTIYW